MDNLLGGNDAVRELLRAVSWESGLAAVRRERAARVDREQQHADMMAKLAKLREVTGDLSKALDTLEPWVCKPWRGQDFSRITVPVQRRRATDA